MTVRVTPQARRHLDSIARYLSQRNPDASRRIGRRIRETFRLIEAFPDIGHHGTLTGTKELVVAGLPYIVVHRIESGGDVIIIGVYHGAQLRPGRPSS